MAQHTVAAGETLDSIAAQYGLLKATLLAFNPQLGASPPVGQAILVPPVNGIAVDAASGETWQTLAERYGTRADVLFEINGCQAAVPSRVFIPGRNQVPGAAGNQPAAASSQQLSGYPLATAAPIILSYGWQPHPERDELFFNSGIALTAQPGSQALAVADGTVAFAGDQGDTGSLIVINHQQGLQTRYANLAGVAVAVGDRVQQGSPLGTVRENGATGSFLYFEVRTNSQSGWVAQDPLQYVPALNREVD
ncbi:MAG: M23 family metallopeptidase [Leptolyngbya sp. SIO4C1]|nr:M23 family metallopeptidase [Leptolyngbya sp. SIO4C1]